MPRVHSRTFLITPYRCYAIWSAAAICLVANWTQAAEPSLDPVALDRAVTRATTHLSQEVASWKEEHNCYSCHNHGDGARALFAARGAKRDVPVRPIEIAINWLRKPDEWDNNGPDGPFSDRLLARIQFAAALTQAIENGVIADRGPLKECAQQLVQEQSPTGAWSFEGADSIGGPTTYGRALATVLAQQAVRGSLTPPSMETGG